MKKSFLTTMPDKAGAFYKACKVISKNNGNIISVNYNRSVDLHTLFLDVSASEDDMDNIAYELFNLGYLHPKAEDRKVVLISMILPSVQGAIIPILDILLNYDINISYMNSQELANGNQQLKMGLFIENKDITKEVLDKISKICQLSIEDYTQIDKMLDNTVFYLDFGSKMRSLLNLSQSQTNMFLINSNKILQNLDERNQPPYKSFEYIRRFAEFVVNHSGANYKPLTNVLDIYEDIKLYMIEPPCGSNSYIIRRQNDLLFIDTGFSCHASEYINTVKSLVPDFDTCNKALYLTHADIDHSGIAYLFDKIYLNQSSYNCFLMQSKGEDDFRELNANHSPYSKLSKIITKYQRPDIGKLIVIGEKTDDGLLSHIAKFNFSGINFEVYEGAGGHTKGESALICKELEICFTGDIFVNIKGFSKNQREFNEIAPFLMSSVDEIPTVSKQVRRELLSLAKACTLFPGHGMYIKNEF